MDNFKIEDYEFIYNLIEEKLPLLKQDKNFKKEYTKLFDNIDELEKLLEENQKEKLNEIITSFYKTEQYYFVLAYCLGFKYASEIKSKAVYL